MREEKKSLYILISEDVLAMTHWSMVKPGTDLGLHLPG